MQEQLVHRRKKMIKHVGKHNGRRVAIVYRTVPEENHMALVLYTDSLPSMIHDEAMKVLESEVGQQSKEFADALFRHIMPDGNNCLTTIHRGGHMKKVPTNQVIVTATANSTCRLDELNEILTQIETGGEALDKLKNLDENRGFGTGKKSSGREVGQPEITKTTAESVNTSNDDVLSDDVLAQQRLDQAAKMKMDAKGLLAEAKRLEQEAKQLAPAKRQNARKPTTRTKKETA